MTPRLRQLLAAHRYDVRRGRVEPGAKYVPRDDEARSELETLRILAAGRAAERRERASGIDLDAVAEANWDNAQYDDAEERRLSAYSVQSWWPSIMSRLERMNVTFISHKKAERKIVHSRRCLREIFGTQEYPYLPSGSRQQAERMARLNPPTGAGRGA